MVHTDAEVFKMLIEMVAPMDWQGGSGNTLLHTMEVYLQAGTARA
jgi:hypothetical protein